MNVGLKTRILPAGAAATAAAARTLAEGGLAAFPTETVYGLGADAQNPDAVRKIFEDRFDAQRIAGGSEFTSVAKGLALRALAEV